MQAYSHANQFFFGVHGTPVGANRPLWYYPVFKQPVENTNLVRTIFAEYPCTPFYIPQNTVGQSNPPPSPYPLYAKYPNRVRLPNSCYSHADYTKLKIAFVGLQQNKPYCPVPMDYECYLLQLKAQTLQIT
mgnify:CR=1 FL=1